jgi:hypothetical protein
MNAIDDHVLIVSAYPALNYAAEANISWIRVNFFKFLMKAGRIINVIEVIVNIFNLLFQLFTIFYYN